MIIENLFEGPYNSPHSIFLDQLEKSLDSRLGDKVYGINKLRRGILCEININHFVELLAFLKDNPGFSINGFRNYNVIFKKGIYYGLLNLYSSENNFFILIKIRLNGKKDSDIVIKQSKKYFKAIEFFQNLRDKKKDCKDFSLYAQPLDGMDCFDIFINLEEDIIADDYIDIGIAKLPIGNEINNKSLLGLISIVNVFDYNAGIFPELALCLAFENLLQMRISKRAKYIRMIVSELFRISNHLNNLANISQILGYDIVYNLIQTENERVLRLLEFITGSRKTPNFIRVGGVKKDLNKEKIINIKRALPDLEKKVNKIEGMLLGNIIIFNRLREIGVIRQGDAVEYGITGPNLRASGLRKDLRKDHELLLYNKVSFITPMEKYGDALSRFSIRFKEIYYSINLIIQILENLPEGIIKKINNLNNLDFPLKATTASVECPHGIFQVYLEVEHKKVDSLAIMGPSINSLMLAEKVLRGAKIEDINIILSSLDISCGEVITNNWD